MRGCERFKIGWHGLLYNKEEATYKGLVFGLASIDYHKTNNCRKMFIQGLQKALTASSKRGMPMAVQRPLLRSKSHAATLNT